MRKADIKPGELYAYKPFGRHDEPVPVKFLSPWPHLGDLWRAPLGRSGEARAFVPVPPPAKPRPGLASNSGAIGYPAVLLEHSRPSDHAMGLIQAVTFEHFKNALNARADRHIRFLVVTSLAKVICKWEDREQ
jgi:hypothetical protein